MKIDKYLSHLPAHLANRVQSSLHQGIQAINKLGFPVQSVVLGGGWKNREVHYTSQEIDGDLDIFIFSNWLPLLWRRIQRLNTQLDETITNPRVHYRGAMPMLLSHSKTFWAYKLKQEGIVVQGDQQILERIQATNNNITPIEAVRILFQTLVGWLMFFEIKYPDRDSITTILRAYLNMGDACLAFTGNLAPSYQARASRFVEMADNFNIKPELVNRIKQGYEIKTTENLQQYLSITSSPTMSQAKQDCLELIKTLMSRYLNNGQPIDQQLNTMGQNLRPHYIFNIAFYTQLRSVHLSPKFLPLLQIRATDLYLMAYYHLNNQPEQYNRLMQRFFTDGEFNKEMLVKLFTLWPTPSTIEL